MLDLLRPLAVFARVAELGSFRAAARQLGLSPSVVSHHIAELEARLGVALLYRSTRRLALTPAGDRLLAGATAMATAAQQGLDAVNAAGEGLQGPLRVTAPAFLADTPWPEHLAEFSRVHPKVELAVTFSEQPRDLLASGLDLAIRAGHLRDSSLIAKRVGELRRVLVASPHLLHRQRAPQNPFDLQSWPFVQLSMLAVEVELEDARTGLHTQVAVAARVQVDNAAAMRALALAGAGAAVLPEVLVRGAVQRGELRVLLDGWTVPSVPVHAVWPPTSHAVALTRRFVDFAAPRLAELLGERPRQDDRA